MVYKYRIDCWIPPRSGYEVISYNNTTKKIKSALKVIFGQSFNVDKAVDAFNKNLEGLIPECLIVESDKPFNSNQNEIDTEIQKRYPGAVIVAHHILEAVPITN